MSDIGQFRELIAVRERYRCLRCNAAGSEWHHRRSRRVRDQHTHCRCNGVFLCPKCHRWVHSHPAESREEGWIVSQWEREPGNIPLTLWVGNRFQLCNGKVEYR